MIDKSKVYVKSGRDSKAVDVSELIVGNQKLGEIIARAELLEQAYTKLTEQLKTCHIIEKQKEYLIEIDGQVKTVKELKIIENLDKKGNLELYEIKGQKLVLKKGVLAL